LSLTAVPPTCAFDPQLDAAPQSGPEELVALRRAAAEAFRQTGFPTLKDEEWRYTSVKPITSKSYVLAQEPAETEHAVAEKSVCANLVVVDGRFVPELSDLQRLPEGVTVLSLQEACENRWGEVGQYLGQIVDWRFYPFAALNTAHLLDGIVVWVDHDRTIADPVQVTFVATKGRVAHPRLLLYAGNGSALQVVSECYAEKDAFLNVVEEGWFGEGASVRYTRLQDAHDEGGLIATFTGRVMADARVETETITLGGGLVRNDSGLILAGENIHATLDGLYLGTRNQHIDHHTFLDHTKPNCSSFENYKGILDGSAVGVFNGKIFVRPGAQKTDSKQSNRNLLLSRDATVNSKPQLEIFADDVKCTHGATIGQIEPSQLFYLQSRGIPKAQARQILTFAFANEIVEKIPHEPLRLRLEEEIFERFTPSREET
jgi:Fe-S cluster assembly protein SufD